MRKLLCLLAIVAATAATAAAQNNPPPDSQLPAGLTVGDPDWANVYISLVSGSSHQGGSRRGSASSAPWRAATVELTNAGTKEIRSVRFDFVFADARSGAEVLRLSLHDKKRLRAGETRMLGKPVKATETNRRGDGARLSVELKEVVYADGSVWTPGG